MSWHYLNDTLECVKDYGDKWASFGNKQVPPTDIVVQVRPLYVASGSISIETDNMSDDGTSVSEVDSSLLE